MKLASLLLQTGLHDSDRAINTEHIIRCLNTNEVQVLNTADQQSTTVSYSSLYSAPQHSEQNSRIAELSKDALHTCWINITLPSWDKQVKLQWGRQTCASPSYISVHESFYRLKNSFLYTGKAFDSLALGYTTYRWTGCEETYYPAVHYTSAENSSSLLIGLHIHGSFLKTYDMDFTVVAEQLPTQTAPVWQDTFLSPTLGFVRFDHDWLEEISGWSTIVAPEPTEVIMTSFLRLGLLTDDRKPNCKYVRIIISQGEAVPKDRNFSRPKSTFSFTLNTKEHDDLLKNTQVLYNKTMTEIDYSFKLPEPEVYHSHVLHVVYQDKWVYRWTIDACSYMGVGGNSRPGVHLLFSYHTHNSIPQKLPSGLWNCSSPEWSRFKPHLRCNLMVECYGGEDEQSCHHTVCQHGGFVVGNRCYVLKRPPKALNYRQAKVECANLGGYLASFNSKQELYGVMSLVWDQHRSFGLWIGGVLAWRKLPLLYRYAILLDDKTVAYHMDYTDLHGLLTVQDACCLMFPTKLRIDCILTDCSIPRNVYVLCEMPDDVINTRELDKRDQQRRPPAQNSSSAQSEVSDDSFTKSQFFPSLKSVRALNLTAGDFPFPVSPCLAEHVTHTFLRHDCGGKCRSEVATATRSAPVESNPLTLVNRSEERIWADEIIVSAEMESRIAFTPLPLFPCKNEVVEQHVPYTLVCDYRADCADASDESFCTYSQDGVLSGFCSLSTFPCGVDRKTQRYAGDCYSFQDTCDGVRQCFNEQDEENCLNLKPDQKERVRRLPPPAIVHFDGYGHHINTRSAQFKTRRRLSQDEVAEWKEKRFRFEPGLLIDISLSENYTGRDHHENFMPQSSLYMTCPNTQCPTCPDAPQYCVTCPDTHYQCPNNGYCLPIFTRCNDVIDCPGKEDEVGCEEYRCPGLYRCRGSRSCVHPSYLCDGLHQCPQHDDELYCRWPDCPGDCVCEGLSYRCWRRLEARQFLRLRYLDAARSGMGLGELSNNSMLIHISLAHCSLQHVDTVTLDNLHSLDLSHNLITSFDLSRLGQLPRLRTLVLAANPMTSLYQTTSLSPHRYMNGLDLSRTSVLTLNLSVLSALPALQTLNLSYSGVRQMTGDGLRVMSRLRQLDLSGCSVTTLPGSAMRELQLLRSVATDDYSLCCPQLLPAEFNVKNCLSPQSPLSSCDSLLGSLLHRVAVAVMASLAICCNVTTLTWSVLAKHTRNRHRTATRIFLTQLSVSDLLMGVYLAIIGVADRLYDGVYLTQRAAWQEGVMCRVLGVVSLTATNVSVSTMFWVTLERCLAVSQRYSHRRFSARGATVACVFTWTVAVILAVIPLMPAASHWRLYSRSGLCLPLPVSALHASATGHAFTVGVTLVINIVLLLSVSVGFIFIVRRLPSRHDVIEAALGTDNETANESDTTATKKIKEKKTDNTETRAISPVHTLSASQLHETNKARSLLPVTALAVLLWLPVCVWVIVQQSAGWLRMSDTQQVTLLLLTWPLRCALNPILGWLGVVQERRRHEQRDRLMKWLGVKGNRNALTNK